MKILSQKNISRLEKLRGNIIQQIFSTEGAVRPDVLIEDEHLIRLVKKVSICFLDNVAEREEVSPWKVMLLFLSMLYFCIEYNYTSQHGCNYGVLKNHVVPLQQARFARHLSSVLVNAFKESYGTYYAYYPFLVANIKGEMWDVHSPQQPV